MQLYDLIILAPEGRERERMQIGIPVLWHIPEEPLVRVYYGSQSFSR